MAGTLLRDDWQRAVEDELKQHAQGIYQTAQRGLQIVQDAPRPDPNQVFQELQGYAQSALQAPQQAVGGIVQVGQQAVQDATQVQSQLQEYANGLFASQPPQQPVQPEVPAGASPFEAGQAPQTGTFQDYARQAAQRAGVDPEIFVRQIQQESGFDPRAKSPAGATGIAQIVPRYHPGVDPNEPYASLDYAANLMRSHLAKYGGDYSKALAAYNAGAGAVDRYGGVPPFEETQTYVQRILGGARQQVQQAVEPLVRGAQAVTRAVHAPSTPEQTPGTQIANAPNADGQVFPLAGRPTNRPDATYHSQGGSDLMAPRGTPVLNMRGGTVTSVYTDNGSHQAGGNAVMIRGDDGLDYYYAHFDQPPGLKPGQRVETGVQIGAVGNSGNAWKGGTGETHLHIGIGRGISNGVGSEGGLGRNYNAQKVLADLLPGVGQATTTAGAAPATGEPTEPARMGVVAVGDQTRPAARPPIYAGQMVPGEPERNPLQVVGDVVGGAQAAAQQRIEDLQRQLDELRTQLEPYNRPPLAAGAPARQAVEQAIGGAAEAAGGAIAAPGRAARTALGEPEAGYSELPLGPSPGGGRVLGAGPPAFPAGSVAAQVESGQRDVRTLSPAEGAEYTAQIMGAGVPGVVDTYRALAQAKREAIEAGNPIRDVFFLGGVSSAVADAVADPITWALPWTRIANLGANMAVQAGLNPIGGRIAGEALMNGLQNAALEMAQRDATPEKVGIAFLAGAGFGGAVRGLQETPVARQIGRQIMDARGRGWPALQQFLRDESGELDIDAVTRAAARAGRAPEVRPEPQARLEAPTRPLAPRPRFQAPDEVAVVAAETGPVAPYTGAPDVIRPGRPPVTPEEVGRFDVDLQPIVRNERRLYFGGAPGELAADRPTFLTSDRNGAQWYATERAPEGNGIVREVPATIQRPATFKDLEDAARAVSATAEDVPRYSQYAGDNPLDLIYVPSVREELERRGFDAVVAWDVLENREIPVAVVWRRGPEPQVPPGGRLQAQAQVPFSLNVGGAALGGYAGAVATPEEATPEERLRNIGLGAATGFVGGRLATRRLGPPGAAAAAEAGAFRAPMREAPAFRPGEEALRATTTEPPGGRPAREPRTLGEVHSNRYILREAGPDERPMTDEELGTHYDQLEQRMADVRARTEAIDELLRNPNQKVQRPPWAAGYTNVQVAEIARRHGVSPYTEYWWEPLGLEAGTGEVRYDVGESGVRGIQTERELGPAELRREQRALEQERQDLLAAADQLGTAGPGTRFAPREVPTGPEGELPYDGGPVIAEGAVESGGPSGNLAEDIVTRNGTRKRPSGLKGLWQEPGQVVGEKEGVIGRGVADADTAGTSEPSVRTKQLMPNLDAMLGDEMPEVRTQIQKAVEDNPELFEAYQQGRISHESLRDDLARRVGMSTKDWLKTPVGKGFSTPELVALQAAAVDAQTGAAQMAREIMNRGGVDNLTPEEVAFGLSNLFDTTRLLAVARGGRSSAGRSLNALKIGFDKRLARDITSSNEKRAADHEAAAARRGAVRAARLLDKTRDLEKEAEQARNKVREAGLPKNIEQQIADAYEQLDRYQAMTLHEKADDFNHLAKERADRAAARKERVRSAPEELLSALKDELAAERKIFAGRKDTWETMAFWDSKAAEQAAEKRRAFRGGLYLEQQRKAARLAEKANEERAARAWDAEMRRQTRQTQRATTILEAIGGEKPSRDLLKAFTEAVASDDPMVAAKFLKGLSRPQTKFGQIVELARNANIMRLAGMLSSTATHLINSGGNVIQVPLEMATRAGVVGIDVLRSAITGGERQAYAAELLPMLKAWGPGFASQWDNVKRQLATGISPSELADLSTLRPGFRSGLPGRVGEVVDPVIEMPLRTLKASDIAFRGAAFAMQAQRVAVRRATQEGFEGAQRTGRANNIVANLEDYPELYREAAEQAARMVYQERRTVPGLSAIRARGTAADVGELAVSQVVPFRTTPANIFAQGFGLGPLGGLGVLEAVGTRGGIAARVAAGELPPERLGRQTLLAEERVARAAIGTGILAMGYMLGSQRDEQGKPKGMLTAMYDEDEASTYPPGWRAWSMRVENSQNGEMVYVPLQNFGAAGVPLAMAALLTDAERRGRKVWEGDELMRASTGLGRYALDNTFLQGVSDWVDLLHDPARSGGKFVEGLVASYGPYSGMGRQVQRAQGVASRNPREGWLGLLDALEANYPGLSGNVPEATTALGEPRTPGATGLGAVVGRYDIERDNLTLQALRSAGVDVPREPKVLPVGRGYGVELTEMERDQLKRARGAAIVGAVERERAKPRVAEWERTMQTAAPDSTAYRDALTRYNGAMRAVVSGAAQAANADFQRRLGRDQVQARMKITREIEPAYIGTPAAPVGEFEEAVR